MNAKRALIIAAIYTTLMSLASPAFAGDAPVTEDECRRNGGAVFMNTSGFRECSGGTFDRRLVA
ncbi:MAG: hypothetical protein ACRD0K_24255 [Egibacteraceae bacterium]